MYVLYSEEQVAELKQAFNEFAATGKYPAIFYYVSIVMLVVCIGVFISAVFGFWSTRDLLNTFNSQTKCMIQLVNTLFGFIYTLYTLY